MKRWALPIGLLAIALGAAFYYDHLRARERVGFPAPDFSLETLDGKTIRLSALRGRVVFLNVWATWCPPCREEMPSMERLHRRLGSKDFLMLAVSEDEEGRNAVQPFIDEVGITFPVVLDPKGIIPQRYPVTGYPETFIIDRNGNVVRHVIGPADWASEPVYTYFSQLMAQGDGANPTPAPGDS